MDLFPIYKQHVINAFRLAEQKKSKINEDILRLEGFTGQMTRHLYNNLLNFEDVRYLEIGTYKGSSVCSAMYNNTANIVCIDNWSEFFGPKEEFIYNFNRFKGNNNAYFIECDCFQLDVSVLPKFNIYMYDGNHTEESHYKALQHYYNVLDDIFIFIVDDWNWENIRNATFRSIEALKLEILYDKEIRLTWNNEHSPHPLAGETWWNGIYVAILKKTK
jgi:hypothetical protein